MYAIEELIPHRDGMKLIESIISADEENAVTQSLSNKNWPFYDDNGIDSLVLIELVAQTAGISNGMDRIKTMGIDSKKDGFIVGIKEANFFVDKIPIDCKIITSAMTQFKYDKFREIIGEVKIKNDIVGKVILQVFQNS